jgi:hypothetical protein
MEKVIPFLGSVVLLKAVKKGETWVGKVMMDTYSTIELCNTEFLSPQEAIDFMEKKLT